MTKKSIKLDISANFCTRDTACIGIGEAEYNQEYDLFWINTNFQNPKGEDDYMTISFSAAELLRVIGESISDPCEC